MRSKALAVGMWLLAFATTALAQQQAALWLTKSNLPTAAEAPFVIESRVAEVAGSLAVTDRSGKPVPELNREDLQILDNGKPAVITQIRQQVWARQGYYADWE